LNLSGRQHGGIELIPGSDYFSEPFWTRAMRSKTTVSIVSRGLVKGWILPLAASRDWGYVAIGGHVF